MKEKKGMAAMAAAMVAISILLLAVFWPHSPPQPMTGNTGAGSGEAAYAPADTLLSMEGIQPTRIAVVHGFGPPEEWFVAGALGQTYTEALSGAGFRTGREDVYLGQSPPDGPYLSSYVIGRAYPGWDTSLLPDEAQVLSATLVLELPAGGGREKPLDVAVYRGTWTPPIDLDDWQIASAKGLPGGQEMGRWRLAASPAQERGSIDAGQGVVLYAPEPARTIRAPLDPKVVNLTGITRLELRHAGEGSPPTAAGVLLLERAMISLEVEYRP